MAVSGDQFPYFVALPDDVHQHCEPNQTERDDERRLAYAGDHIIRAQRQKNA
jgi:hypothetical protein